MNINKQVTDVEHTLTDSDTIVSNTDLKGVITYVNDTFIRISGYSREELIGISHNVVRHPDMPREAFADLWRAMKAGRPWTGIVKNRCKNGDYYWVLANATPLVENDQLVGYMSVRSKAEPEQIKAANAAYRLFREGKADGLKIHDGKVIKNSLFGQLNLLNDFNIKSRLVAIIAWLSVLLLVVGGIGLFGMSKAKESLRSVYEDSTLPIGQIASIQKLLLTNRLNISASLNNPTAELIRVNTADVEQNIGEITRLWDTYRSTKLSNEEKALADAFAENSKYLVENGLKPAIAALRANDISQANNAVEQINRLYPQVKDDIQQLMQLQLDAVQQEYQATRLRHEAIRNIAIGLMTAGIA